MLSIPKKVPESGYYYHYKHNPNGEVNNYSYEVLGVGFHTEDDCREQDQVMVVYRPLYTEAQVYLAGRSYDLRPLEMFMESVLEKGVMRFVKITDPLVIAQLNEMRLKMYGS